MTVEHNIRAVAESVYFALINQGFDSETAAEISETEAEQYRVQCDENEESSS